MQVSETNLSAAAAAGDAKQCAVLLGAGANPAARGADGSNSAGVERLPCRAQFIEECQRQKVEEQQLEFGKDAFSTPSGGTLGAAPITPEVRSCVRRSWQTRRTKRRVKVRCCASSARPLELGS